MKNTVDKDIVDKVQESKVKKDYGIDMQHQIHLIKCHDMVGEMIAQAKARGEFDNLEGAGQPLDLNQNPYEGDMHMAYKILKDAGFAPFWIELGKDIDAQRQKFDKEVDYFKRYTRITFSENPDSKDLHRFERRKEFFYKQSRERLTEIWRKILDYNLQCPVASMQRPNFDVEEEMNRLVQEIEDCQGAG